LLGIRDHSTISTGECQSFRRHRLRRNVVIGLNDSAQIDLNDSDLRRQISTNHDVFAAYANGTWPSHTASGNPSLAQEPTINPSSLSLGPLQSSLNNSLA
jgi:hypothetical protein